MKQTKLAALAVVLLLSMANVVFAQEPDPLYEQVKAQFNVRFGNRYRMTVFLNVDSCLGRPQGIFNNYRIEDPYGTLAYCIIFTGAGVFQDGDMPPGFIGVYKEGQFLWLSDTLIEGYAISFNGMVAATDLNNDGKVDIIVGTSGGSRHELEYLWIVSWDGRSGVIINDSEGDEAYGYVSKIASLRDLFEFHDLNGDRVKEIIGEWYLSDESEETARVIYSWNGQKYGNWGGGPQFPPSGYLPRNRLTATVKAKAVKMPGAYRYQYVVVNNPTSQQEINEVLVAARTDSIRNGVGPERWNFFVHPRPKVGWVLPPFQKQFIPPGGTDSRFSYEATGPPAPVSCYVRGRNETLQETPPYNEESWYADVVGNSYVTTTVGAVDPPFPFIPTDLLDTLTIYTAQSRSLGWITTQTVADKYLNYLSTAKTQLQQNNTAAARTTLQSVLRDVDVDSSSMLTSEAYALLRYNTEYLLDQLPAPQEFSIDDLIALKHQAEAKGWIGDGNFVKELDNAKKHLARGDSVNCAKELEKFQEKVKKEYDKTVEDQKKHKPRDKRFVTEEGYRSLTEGAQKIIDRLPKKK
jgi:hypothetical protein